MMQLKARVGLSTTVTFYTIDGFTVKNISSVSYEGSTDVFTVTDNNGQYTVRDPNRNMSVIKPRRN